MCHSVKDSMPSRLTSDFNPRLEEQRPSGLMLDPQGSDSRGERAAVVALLVFEFLPRP